MMYIYYVCHEFVTEEQQNSGGIATYMYNVAKTFQERGNDVLVVVLSERNNDSIMYDNIRIERVFVSPKLKKLKKIVRGKWLYNLISAWLIRIRIDKLIKNRKPDIIHYANFKAVGLFSRKDIPCITRISSDNVLWREAFRSDFEYEKSYNRIILEDKLEYAALKRSNALFCPSNVVAQITKDRIGKNVNVIESPAYVCDKIDCSIYDKYAGELGTYLLYFGSFSRLKGLHYIGENLNRILSSNKNLKFLFIGLDIGYFGEDSNLSCKDYLEMKAGEYRDQIIVLEPMYREQLIPFIINSYACVFPSMFDNLPNTCIEAMNCAKIIIGTDGASFEQLINDGENGFLVYNDVRKNLPDVIERVLALTPEEKNRIEICAKQTIERLHPDKIYEQVKLFYRNTIKEFEKQEK